MSKVDIAMATYNGASYIAQQINSILSQTFTDWRLFIRDDGSSDNTVSIIKKYVGQDPRIIFIEDSLGGLGVSRNFETIISYSTADYTMLSDQDDIWFDNKIMKSIIYIQQVEKHGQPTLVISNSILTNSDVSVKYGNNYLSNTIPCFENFIFHNAGYQGAAMIFNKSLREKLFPFLERSIVHDYHISLIGLLIGKVYFFNESLMFYRRHKCTITISNRTLVQRFRAFIRGDQTLYTPEMVDYLIRLYTNRISLISNDNKTKIETYLNIINSKTSYPKKIKLVKKYNFTLRNSRLYLIIKLLLTNSINENTSIDK